MLAGGAGPLLGDSPFQRSIDGPGLSDESCLRLEIGRPEAVAIGKSFKIERR
jgi:hypothetical protein